MAKLKYFNFEKEVLKKRPNSDIYILLGGRGCGKSYSVKNFCLRDAYTNGYGRYVNLLRRMDRNISPSHNEEYYADVDISNITNNAKDTIRQYRSYIYAEKSDDKGGYVKSERVTLGRVSALSIGQSYKSNFDRRAYKWTIYEEFITDEVYLLNEPNRLQEFLQTVYGNDRTDGKAILIGNTLSTVCPYYSAWDLGKMGDMQAGEFRDFRIDNMTVSIYMCYPLIDDKGDKVTSKFLFGTHAKKQHGIWDVHQHPYYYFTGGETCIYTCVFCRYENMYLMRCLLNEKNIPFWYIERKTTPIKKGERVIGLLSVNDDWLHTATFQPISRREKVLFDLLFQKNRVAFDTNLTGDEFFRLIKDYNLDN